MAVTDDRPLSGFESLKGSQSLKVFTGNEGVIISSRPWKLRNDAELYSVPTKMLRALSACFPELLLPQVGPERGIVTLSRAAMLNSARCQRQLLSTAVVTSVIS